MDGYHVLGQRSRSMGYTVDGINGKEPGVGNFGGTNEQISTTQDTFEEVKIHTTGTPAEFGHAAGGLMPIVFRSGTNDFHGSTKIGASTSAICIAPTWSNCRAPTRSRSTRRHFCSLVRWCFRSPTTGTTRRSGLPAGNSTANTPGPPAAGRSAYARDASGRFFVRRPTSPRPLPIYDPFSTRLEGTTWIRDPFPGT